MKNNMPIMVLGRGINWSKGHGCGVAKSRLWTNLEDVLSTGVRVKHHNIWIMTNLLLFSKHVPFFL